VCFFYSDWFAGAFAEHSILRSERGGAAVPAAARDGRRAAAIRGGAQAQSHPQQLPVAGAAAGGAAGRHPDGDRGGRRRRRRLGVAVGAAAAATQRLLQLAPRVGVGVAARFAPPTHPHPLNYLTGRARAHVNICQRITKDFKVIKIAIRIKRLNIQMMLLLVVSFCVAGNCTLNII